MRKRKLKRKYKGRKRLIFSMLAVLTGSVSWQNLEGIGLGNRHVRGFSSVRQKIDLKD